MTHRVGFSLFLFVLGLPCGCDPPPAGAPASEPSAAIVKEADLNTILLAPESESRLGITTAPVERRSVMRTRTLGGEVLVPSGLEITVKSPLAGEILSASSEVTSGADRPPRPGQLLEKKQEIFVLRPLLSPEAMISYQTSRVQATGEVEKATVEVEAAKVAFDRAVQLLRAKGGRQRDVDDAKARRLLAEARLEAAGAERALLERIEKDTAAGSPIALAIESPLAGVLLSTHARPGQVVEAGALLFKVARLDRLWIRVPVYTGELSRFDEKQAVEVGAPGASPGAESLGTARPVTAPPSADPIANTVDLFYEIENDLDVLRPGQKVSVTIPLRSETESLVIPWSAVVHDVHGGTWVYEQTAPHRFVRRRVEVLHVDRGVAVLGAGPPAGTSVVTAGVAELFGTEFGIGK